MVNVWGKMPVLTKFPTIGPKWHLIENGWLDASRLLFVGLAARMPYVSILKSVGGNESRLRKEQQFLRLTYAGPKARFGMEN